MHEGKILDVDLSSRLITEKTVDRPLREQYIGGAGINARMLYDEVSPSCDPLSHDNVLIIGCGPLVGSGFPAATRFTMTTKSPLTGIYTDSSAGGRFGIAMKRAGYDHLVIRGAGEDPVVIVLGARGEVRIEDGCCFWGLDTVETDIILRERYGPCETLRIGPAGEHLVKFANVVSSSRRLSFNGRGGIGCVMGGKRLKAIVVTAAEQLEGSRWEGESGGRGRLKELAYHFGKLMQESERCKVRARCGTMDIMAAYSAMDDLWEKNYQFHLDPAKIEDLLPPVLLKKYLAGKVGCDGCPLQCTLRFTLPEGRFGGTVGEKCEFGHAFLLGPNLGIYTFPPLILLANAANRLGLDSMELGSTLGMFTECCEKGRMLSGEGSEDRVTFGDLEGYLKLVEKIAFRQGIGNLLAEGVKKASETLGPYARQCAFHIKGQGYRLDGNQAWMLGYVVSPRGGDHLKAMPFTLFAPGRREVIEQHVGCLPDEKGYDPREPHAKGRVVWWHENFKTLVDCLGLCIFPVVGLFLEGHFSVETIAELYHAATGNIVSRAELWTAAERIYQLMKAFNVRLGVTRKDDTFVKRTWDGGTVGEVPYGHIELDQPGMLEEYYRYRGYGREGLPSPVRLQEVGLQEVAAELERAHLLSSDPVPLLTSLVSF